jgi:2-C-methyl-D-erythritol 2,4-cyclodiphosphate synthase
VSFRIGLGFDAHRLVPGRPLVLGGIEIPFDKGLEGHSDGDVALHALTDALLGAVGGPDIGRLFPSGEQQWKGAASRIFIERAVQTVKERGYHISHVDIVIIAEAPRLAPHFEAMQVLIAELLGISAGSVGLKATTTDGMGYMGRGEGMAAQAIALVTSADET